jgi:MerR family transcriptional regulator/heat shock protein HspR
MAEKKRDQDRAIYIISVAAELAGVHPQTLRIYERKGLVAPQRTSGNTRRYSERDVQLLRRIQELTGEGINLAGVVRILDLEKRLGRAEAKARRAQDALMEAEEEIDSLLTARDSMALVPLRDVRRIRRALRSDRIESLPRRVAVPPAATN